VNTVVAEPLAPSSDSAPRVLQNVVRTYIALVAIGGLAAAWFAVSYTRLDPLPVVLFCIAAAVAERVRVAVSEETPISLSLSLAVILAALVAFGPGGAVLAAITARLAVGVAGRPRPQAHKTIFNVGLFAIQAAAAGFVYEWLGGALGHGHIVALRDLAAAAAALATAMMVNWLLLVMVIHLTTGRSVFQIWQDDLRWTPVQMAVSGLIGFTLGMTYMLYGWVGTAVYVAPIFALRESMRMYTVKVRAQIDELTAAHQDADAANARLTETNDGLLKMLAAVIDARDIYLYGHSVQASKYAGEVARKLGLSPEQVRLTELGALLHDLGKVGVSELILNKPARLTEEEYKEVQSHCDIGYQLLSNLPGFEDVADIVHSHHERYDGKGYPRQLRGTEIPIGARIVSAVESVEAMVSDRPYRKGMTADEVLKELADGAGTQWDPDVVRVFSDVLSADRKHLVMRNSALEIALARAPLAELIKPSGQPMDHALRGMTETFRTSVQPIFILDNEFRIVSANAQAERVTGRTEAALQGSDWAELCAAPELRRTSPESFFGATRHMSLQQPSGLEFDLEVTGTPLRTNSATYWLVLAHDVTERVRIESELKRQIGTDFLTQLANREGLHRLAEQLLVPGSTVTLVLLDLDNLKLINDTHGHLAGDDAIKALGAAIAEQLRHGDVGARIGGDEFAVMIRSSDEAAVAPVVGRIATALRAADLPVRVNFSHGAATWDGVETFADLMRRADEQLYAQKRARYSPTVIPLKRTS